MRLGEDDARTALAYLEADLERLNAAPRRAGNPRSAFSTFVIRFDLILSAIAAPLFAWYAIAADWTLGFLALMFAASFALCLAVERRAARPAADPRPDYAHIARMEREVYGETFHHDGAPAPREPVQRSIVISDASPGAVTCERGYHIYSYNEPCCVLCGEKI